MILSYLHSDPPCESPTRNGMCHSGCVNYHHGTEKLNDCDVELSWHRDAVSFHMKTDLSEDQLFY